MTPEAATPPLSLGIMGAGAVGSYLGGLLVRAGVSVRMVARGPQALALAHHGLNLATRTEEFHVDVDVSDDVATLKSVDIVLLTVKSTDTDTALQQLLPHLAADATVISVQNGVRNWERIAQAVGQDRVLAGVALFGVEFLEPGRVSNPLPGPLMLGDPIGFAGRRLRLAAELIGSGLTVEALDDIHSAMWAKLVINTDMAVLALTGSSYPTGLLDRDVQALCRLVMEEALVVIQAAGLITSASIVTDVMDRKLAMLRLPRNELRARVETMDVNFTPSTLQSVLRGRTSETPFLNGEIVAVANRTSQSAPLNQVLTRLMEGTREPSAFMPPAVLRTTMAAADANLG